MRAGHDGLGRLTIAAGLLAGLAMASNGWAQPGPRGPRRGFGPPGGGPMAMLREANLSDTQREQVKAVLDSERERLAEEHQALAEARRDLQEAVRQDAEEPTLRDKAAQIGTLEGDLAVTMAEVHQQVQGILTDEQKQQIEKQRAERQQRRDQWRERQKQRLPQMRDGGGPPFGGPMPFDEPEPFDGPPPPPDEPGQ